MFLGKKIVDYCIMYKLVVATPCRHRGLNTFLIFFLNSEYLLHCCVVVVAKLKIVACPAVKIGTRVFDHRIEWANISETNKTLGVSFGVLKEDSVNKPWGHYNDGDLKKFPTLNRFWAAAKQYGRPKISLFEADIIGIVCKGGQLIKRLFVNREKKFEDVNW